jgi:predicted Zn-ribbon and HTH transcriptional regulator
MSYMFAKNCKLWRGSPPNHSEFIHPYLLEETGEMKSKNKIMSSKKKYYRQKQNRQKQNFNEINLHKMIIDVSCNSCGYQFKEELGEGVIEKMSYCSHCKTNLKIRRSLNLS